MSALWVSKSEFEVSEYDPMVAPLGLGPLPRAVPQESRPCVLHAYHSPITVVNELHHPLPQAWQRRLWGKVLDHRVVAVCATGHNSVHTAIDFFDEYGTHLPWCVGRTRDLVEVAFERLMENR